jgi:molybdopterin converting factor small subunit
MSTSTIHPAHAAAEPTAGGTTVTVRFFAGAAQAAGGSTREVTVAAPDATLADVTPAIADDADEPLAKVLAVATWLVGGARAEAGTAIPAGAVVDCLPPFAGG